jgi:hypothetical protein
VVTSNLIFAEWFPVFRLPQIYQEEYHSPGLLRFLEGFIELVGVVDGGGGRSECKGLVSIRRVNKRCHSPALGVQGKRDKDLERFLYRISLVGRAGGGGG